MCTLCIDHALVFRSSWMQRKKNKQKKKSKLNCAITIACFNSFCFSSIFWAKILFNHFHTRVETQVNTGYSWWKKSCENLNFISYQLGYPFQQFFFFDNININANITIYIQFENYFYSFSARVSCNNMYKDMLLEIVDKLFTIKVKKNVLFITVNI